MKAKIEVDMDNAVFHSDPLRELAGILRVTGGKLEGRAFNGCSPTDPILIWDSNGNRVGQLTIED